MNMHQEPFNSIAIKEVIVWVLELVLVAPSGLKFRFSGYFVPIPVFLLELLPVPEECGWKESVIL